MENTNKHASPTKYPVEKRVSFHELLRYERQRRGWSQADVSAKVGSDTKSVGRWERGEAFPSPYHRYKLLELFDKNAQEMGLIEGGTDTSDKVSSKTLSPSLAEVARQMDEQLEQLEVESQSGQTEENIHQKVQFEREKQRLELEKQWLELLEKRLEVQKRGVEYALEVAKKVVDTLQPNADEATRTMIIQTLLPTFLHFFSGKELELPFTEP